MTVHHSLTDDEFSALARGFGGPEVVRKLHHAHLSRHLLLVKYLAMHWHGDEADRDSSVAVLARVQTVEPGVYAELLADALTGAWVAVAVRRLRGVAAPTVPPSVDCGHLGALAATAAVRAGLDADLTVHIRAGAVTFPGLGQAILPLPDFTTVTARVRSGQLSVEAPGVAVVRRSAVDTAGWRNLRRLRASAGVRQLDVRLEDLDPYRSGHHAPPTDRLPDADVDAWRLRLDEAWGLLTRHTPERADELAAGLQALIPLAQLDPHSARSATIADAFGALGLTLPGSGVDLAVTLVHEFHHSKLSGLLHLERLHDRSDTTRYFAPWRNDPRPLGGLMQGAYAFLGVADVWRSFRADPTLASQAEQEYANVREQLRHALPSLESSAALTERGRSIVAGMRDVAEGMFAEALPAATVRQAERELLRTKGAWVSRNAGHSGR
jgi:HEXXH motif-containing protein